MATLSPATTGHSSSPSAAINHQPTSAATGRTVAFTTPNNYADRLSRLLALRGHAPLWCPTLTVNATPQSLIPHLSPPPALEAFSTVAFTSRAGIGAFCAAVAGIKGALLASDGDAFLIAALGSDAELLNEEFLLKICPDFHRIKTIVPSTPTPSGLVESLGPGGGRKVLCPVPLVIGIEEPPVVPSFLRELEASGWMPVKVGAYETRWLGPQCAEVIMGEEVLDAIIFTSTAEVEGLLKGLRELGWDWGTVRRKWPELVVAAHGPVTAAGAERLGVGVDVVGSRFDNFEGVVGALDLRWHGPR
ncbi:uncharacterized protein LOC116194292 [Punica granatum]|uniref:Tetrapyrrole biosynthesis uroporphyrinogen III synthase domain-containing protein n=2 Tax=Punica granatum TaxID=22663 RepID=A0A218WJ26_PUNGR|nr:uncharacterized protein LOC116194292 [Punica granatum]OWM72844.1 hypothetical protein CDL15_Pgr021150 [Punica granatum]PKI64690.1 hypothetical protein CRG98_014906 [Punica granatum]